MAKPRIFVSSTFYDLRQVRTDIEKFIKDLGYEPVMFERGSVPYGKDKAPSEYCNREIDTCDVVIAVIGGRRGSDLPEGSHSVSQSELKHAIDVHKQIYIFVERNVLGEFETYRVNKDKKEVRYRHVDDSQVYAFLEELHALPTGNPISPFETAQDIIAFLRNQWAGLFQRLLQLETRREEVELLTGLRESAESLDRLVHYVTEHTKGKDDAVAELLLTTHPVFGAMRKLLHIPYRLYFTNKQEMEALLKVRSCTPVPTKDWDSPSEMEWFCFKDDQRKLLRMSASLFDERGRLIPMAQELWTDGLISLVDFPEPDIPKVQLDDIPF